MRNLSILNRLVLLAAAMLLVLVSSNLYLGQQLRRSVEVLSRDARLVDDLGTAVSASDAFGDFKYWLLELAVGPRERSEQRALSARSVLLDALARLEQVDAEAVAVLRLDVGALMDTTLIAIESFNDGETATAHDFLARGLNHIRAVDRRLTDLVAASQHEFAALRGAALRDAVAARRLSLGVTVAASVIACLLTLLVVRSITVPLRRLVAAMQSITSGQLAVDIPTSSRDEIGAMGRTLHLFREHLRERVRLLEEQMRAQRDLQRTEERLSDAIESISEGFALFDAEDRLVVCNGPYRELVEPGGDRLKTPGASFEEIIRATVRAGLVREAEDDPQAWIEQRLAGHRRPRGPHLHQRRNGVWLRVNETRTREGGTVAVYMDVTELKQREEELRRAKEQAEAATRTKSQFLANMSHELRTPLNAVIGLAEMLRDEVEETDSRDFAEPLERILSASRHLLGLISDILDLSKIEAGYLDLDVEEFSVAELLHDVVTTAEPLARKNGNRLELSLEPDLGAMRSDATRVRQVLLNLLGNASKFTEDGLVRLAAVRRRSSGRDRVEITVSDTGIGMGEEDIERLFEEFTQADASSTRKHGGTGLGLAISRRLCDVLGGEIRVSSQRARGTTFVVSLPSTLGDGPQPPPGLGTET